MNPPLLVFWAIVATARRGSCIGEHIAFHLRFIRSNSSLASGKERRRYSILNLQHLTDRRGAIPFVSPPPFSGKPFGKMVSILNLVATILLAAVCKLVFDTWRVLRSITYVSSMCFPFNGNLAYRACCCSLPYRIVFFGPKNMVINHYLPRIPWISMGNSWASDEKHTGNTPVIGVVVSQRSYRLIAYRENGLDVFVTVRALRT